MQALLLTLALVAQTTAPLPGDGYVRVTADMVLRAGPSDSHPGVLSVPAGTVLRASDQGSGSYRAVFLAQGFPIYLHSDYVALDSTTQTVRVLGQRVNARLLPCTLGLLPVGRVGSEAGELLLLDEEGDWVRVLAPVELPLSAPETALESLAEGAAGSLWRSAWEAREGRREARRASARASDPSWLAEHDARLQLAFEGRVDLATLTAEALETRARRLATLGQPLRPGSESQLAWKRLLEAVSAEQQQRAEALAAEAATRAAQARRQQLLAVEARALALGLSYQGQGQPRRVEGRVLRLTDPSQPAPVFAIAAGEQTLKLTAPKGATDLSTLEGREVILQGRTLRLMNVAGPVLVVDQVVDDGR